MVVLNLTSVHLSLTPPHTHTQTPCHSQLGPPGSEEMAGMASTDWQLGEINVCQHLTPLRYLAVTQPGKHQDQRTQRDNRERKREGWRES